MRVLIIGGTGFSGPYITRRLSELGHTVDLFHRKESRGDLSEETLRIHGDRHNLVPHADELRRFAPQIVIDMIALTEQDARSVSAVFRGVARRVITISSQDVYQAYGRVIGTEPGQPLPTPLAESSPLRSTLYPYRAQARSPEDPGYHYEKILVEQAVMNDPELPGTIVRFPMMYGPGDARQHRLFEYLKRMEDNRPAILLEEGLAAWRWTKGYVEDLAEAVVLAVTNNRAAGQIYNAGEQHPLTWAEWVRAIGHAAGWNGEIVTAPLSKLPRHLQPEHRTDQHLIADTTRIREELGYQELVSREEALNRAVAWERSHPPEHIDLERFDYALEDELLRRLG